MLNKLYHIWRVIITGSAFFIFNVGGLLLTLLVFPFVGLAYKNNALRMVKSKLVVHYTFKFFIRYMIAVGIMRLEVKGLDALKSVKGKVIVANHPSLIDVVVLISMIRQADCVVKAALWKTPFLKGVVTNTGYINNDLEVENFIACCKSSLDVGNNLVIFPEGTRTEPNKQPKFKRGAANIAIRTKHDLQPVTLRVTPSTLTKDKKWYQVSPVRFTVSVEVKPTFEVAPYVALANEPVAVRKLTKDLEEYFIEEIYHNE